MVESLHSMEAIQQRIFGIEREQGETRDAVRMLSSRIDERFTALATKLEERSRTPWSNIISACGVTMGVVAVVGSLAYSPVREAVSELNADYKYLTRAEIVPRAEHLEKWRGHEKDIENLRQRMASDHTDLQRQIDSIASKYVDIYSAPQMIKDLNERIRMIESQRSWMARTETK